MTNSNTPPARILFLTPVPPGQVVGGGDTATISFLQLLSRLSFPTTVTVVPMRRLQSWLSHRLLQVLSLTRSIFSSLPSKTLFTLPIGSLRRLRRRVRSSDYDYIIINGGELLFLTSFLPPKQVAVGIEHNVEFLLFAEMTQRLRKYPLISPLFERDLAKLTQTEQAGWHAVRNVICLSSSDASLIEKMEPAIRTLTLPTSFSYPPYRRPKDRPIGNPLRLGFLAKFSWWPNVEAVEWFINQILPKLPQGALKLHLFGLGAERFVKRHPALCVRGIVQRLDVVWEESDIVICPIISGSGINIKFVEALYNGCPVLATSLATRGLPPIRDPAVLCLDKPEEWIKFLSSDAAFAFARTQPRPETSEMFSAEISSRKLSDYLRRIKAL